MTLQQFLDSYQNDESLRTEYQDCDKQTLVKEFGARRVREGVPMRISNISISKEVYSKLGRITASVCSYGFLEHISYPSLVPGAQPDLWDQDCLHLWS